QADMTCEAVFKAPAAVVWDWLNDPMKRARWQVGSGWHAKERPAGRTGRGSSNHCSASNFMEHIQDWRPFDYYTINLVKKPIDMIITTHLIPSENEIRVRR